MGLPTTTHAELVGQHTAPARAQILVVEDEHLVALDIQVRVERMGHHAVVVYSGEEAVKRAATMRFDLVLMDIKLEGSLDGIAAARTIRELYDVPIIYLTAYADNETLERARVTEPYGYLLKPFQERELKASIEMALQRHDIDMHRWEQQEMQRFLADASSRMAATLDYRAVAVGAAELLVPRYADWCMIHLDESDDAVPAFTHTRPGGEREMGPPSRELAQLIATVSRTGRSQLTPLRDLAARSLICVPLSARGQVLGALVVISGRMRPRYGNSDLLFVEDFSHRLGIALDNALLYRKAERAIRMRDDVLAIVSHDLRTPLATVLMQTETLLRHPELRKVGESIARSTQRMNRLIGDLLDASAVNAGHLALECRVHAIGDLVSEAIEMFRSQAEARGITLVESVPDRRLRVSCDRDRLGQVLSNLIDNALKFTPHDGTVKVIAERAPGGVRVEVRDTGCGIPADELPHLFDRFWRAQARRQGAGLGLFIARGIVAAHNSTLEVETEVGAGTRFFFVLPEAPP